MDPIEKFLKEQFTPKVIEDKMGIKCLFQHKDKLVDDGVVFFEFAKKGWSKKPIMSKRQFVIVDADMTDVLQFLNKYYNLLLLQYNLQFQTLLLPYDYNNPHYFHLILLL